MTQTSGSGGSMVGERVRARFDAARRAKQPVGLLCVRVDRSERLHPDRLRELLGVVDGVLEARLDQGEPVIAARADGRLVLAPGLGLAALETLAHELVRAARNSGPTLSVGVAHDVGRDAPSLETLVGVVDAGLEVALRGGGNRMVHTDQYAGVALHLAHEASGEDALGGLAEVEAKTEIETRAEPAQDELPQVVLPTQPPPRSRPSEQSLIETLREALSGDAHSPRVARFQHALEDLLHEQPGQDATLEQVDVLERRVSKLAHALELAEGEIARLQSSPGVELGVASIYREVQGISADEPLEALKRELMAGIFEANAALQGARGERAEECIEERIED